MTTAAPLVIALAMLLVLVRAWRGPSLFDRILAANTFGILTMLALVQLAFRFEEYPLMDIALAYALVNFISLLAFARFFESSELTVPGAGQKKRRAKYD